MAQNLPPPEPKYVLHDGMGPISCLDFDLENSLFVGTQDGWIHVWDLIINRKKSSFQVGNSACLAVKVFMNKLITQSKGEGVSVRSLSGKFELLHNFKNNYGGFCRIEVDTSPTLFIPGENSEIKVMNLDSFILRKNFYGPSNKLGEVMVMKSVKYQCHNLLLVAYESGDFYLWDVLKGIDVSQFKIGNVPMALDFDEEKGKGICGTESDTVIIFRIEANLRFSLEKTLMITNPGVSAAIIRPDKKVAVLGCWDGNLRIYSWKSNRMLGVLSEHTETINSLCYSHNIITMWGSILLAAGSKDRSVSLWSFY